MAKKKEIGKYIGFLALLWAVAAIVMIFLPAIVYKASENADAVTYTGIQVTFGFKETQASVGNLKYETEWFKFSFMNFLPYILLIVGVALTLLKMLGIFKSKLFTLITAACFIAGGILLFFCVDFSIVGTEQITDLPLLSKDYMSLGVGVIIGAILAILAGICKVGDLLLS